MKLKHFPLTVGAVVFCFAALATLPLRTYQFFSVLEPVTGFYKEKSFSVGLLYGMIAAALVVFVAVSFASRKSIGYVSTAVKRPGQAVLSFVVAISLLIDSVICFNVYSGGLSMGFTTADFTSVATHPVAQKIFLVQSVFAIVSAIFFVASGISYFIGKTNASEYKILSLCPELWCVARMVYRFTREISYTRVSDLLFELVMLAFMLLFFMAYAQVNSNVEAKGIEWKLVGYGLPAALMALICFVPRFIVTVTGNQDLLYAQSAAEYCDFAIALFILSVVFTRVGAREKVAAVTAAAQPACVQASVEAAAAEAPAGESEEEKPQE